MKDAFLKFNDGVYLACIWVSGISIAVMSLIIPWGIFTRYVLGTGSQWPEPISIQLRIAPVRSRTASVGSSGSEMPLENASPSAYSRQ